ncbi:MAG: ABC transporter ATP-binding protein/permease [Lachnospiraceae bacterium]|nr:ABC transporter ATP-binding protein/permease [Lachnospiraceae bacterium]
MLKKIYAVLEPKHRTRMLGILVIIVINSGLELLGIAGVFPLIDAVTKPELLHEKQYFLLAREIFPVQKDSEFIALMALALAVIYVAKNVYLIWMNSVFYRFTTNSQKDLAVKMTECYLYQNYAFHVEHNLTELQRNVENDVSSLFTTLLYILQLTAEVLVCTLTVIYLALTDLRTTLVLTALMCVLLLLLLLVMRKRMKQLGEQNRKTYEERVRWFFQSFSGIKEIKTANKEDFFIKGYRDSYDRYSRVYYQRNVLGNMVKPVVEMVCVGGIMVYMGTRILSGEDVQNFVPVLAVFAMAAFRMMPSFNRISGFLNNINFAKPSVNAVYQDMIEMKELQKARRAKQEGAIGFKKELKISGLCFHYASNPGKEVLKDLSMTIPYNSSVALVGPSGAGKTTLADIILGIYEPTGGKVCADGEDIHRHLDAWHHMIGYIPQSIYLMDDTIRANIAFGVPEDEIDDERVWEVLREAQLEEYVKQQEKGLDTVIGDRGVKLSGGQRQRMGIARALYPSPQLLVLDEATSALDSETESAVMEAIYHLAGRITMIVIAHRITTIRSCDEIYRVCDGVAKKISYEEAENDKDKK